MKRHTVLGISLAGDEDVSEGDVSWEVGLALPLRIEKGEEQILLAQVNCPWLCYDRRRFLGRWSIQRFRPCTSSEGFSYEKDRREECCRYSSWADLTYRL